MQRNEIGKAERANGARRGIDWNQIACVSEVRCFVAVEVENFDCRYFMFRK